MKGNMKYNIGNCIGLTFLVPVFFILMNISYGYSLEGDIQNDTSTIEIKGSNNSISESISTTASYNFEPFLLLNGTEYQDIPHNDTLSLQNFTVASWIKNNQSTLPGPAILVNKGGFNSDEEGKNMNYGFWFSSNGIIQGGFETKSGEYFAVNSTEKYNDGKWHFVLLAYDGNLLKLDIDGKEVSTKITGGALPDNTGTQPLRIGANSLEEDKFFNGALDEVSIWNIGLSGKEIKQVYSDNANNTKVKNGQVLHLDFSKTNVTEAATMGSSVTEAATVGPSFKDATKYKVVKVWGGAGTEDGKFLRPHDLDFNNDESILYAVDRDGGRIQAFDKEGNFLFSFGKNGQGDGEFSVPYGLDVDKEGNLWVADRANHRVQKFDSQGNFILKIGGDDFKKSAEPGKFDNPRHVRVDPDNKYVYVADSKNNRVQQFDTNGKFIKVIGKLGDKPGEFNLVTTIEIDPEGNFFTTERGNERIQKFDKDWKPILMWGSKGSGDSQFCHSEHFAIDKYGNVYMNDPQSDPGCSQIPVVKKYDNNGKFITKWGSLGKEPGQFGDPEHMAIDSEGNVYISDRKNDNIQKFAPIS